MRIAVHDPTGCGLGLALGLVEHGHAVGYEGPELQAGHAGGTPLCDTLVTRWLPRCARAPTADDCDLLVAVDVFADFLTALHGGVGSDTPWDPSDPFAPTRNPLAYPARLSRWLELAARAPALAVVDMSDAEGPREVAFEELPHAQCFAREAGHEGPWRPFPYLYNNVLLAIERLFAPSDWRMPEPRRTPRFDWVFCGTVRHPRYGDRRVRSIAHAHRRWPGLRGHVTVAAPFAEVLPLLQQARTCLDLPGAGDLCFRVHEALAVGTPLLRLAPGRVQLPPDVAACVVADPADGALPCAKHVRAVYADHYAPAAAAAALLCGCAADRPTHLAADVR